MGVHLDTLFPLTRPYSARGEAVLGWKGDWFFGQIFHGKKEQGGYDS